MNGNWQTPDARLDGNMNSALRHGATGGRQAWHKPRMTLMPVERTANSVTTGDDGVGPFTGS